MGFWSWLFSTEKDSSHTEEYHLGYLAYLHGLPLYPPSDLIGPECKYWTDGWLKAQRISLGL